MATIGESERIAQAIRELQAKSLKSVELPWFFPAPPGNTPLTLMSTFRAERTYLLQAMRYSMAVNGGYNVTMKVGFSTLPIAYQSNGSVGVSLASVVAPADGSAVSINTVQEYINWVPNGWYLDVGDEVSVLIETSMYPTNLVNVNQFGIVQLFLLESFEQS